MICQICNLDLGEISNKDFSTHLRSHKILTKDYTIKYILQGIHPSCPICGKEPRYTSFSFKEFCIDHANSGYAKGGKKGGTIKQTWNKGETKDTNETIARQAKAAEGEGNHFFIQLDKMIFILI